MDNKRLYDISVASAHGRQCGKTTQLVKAAKALGAIFVCANKVQAKHIEKEYQIETATLDTQLRGSSRPIILDHYAFERLLMEAGNAITKLEAQVEKLSEENKLLKALYDKK